MDVPAEAAEDVKGQACYICMDGAAEEGLVRMCACRGHSGVAHVSSAMTRGERVRTHAKSATRSSITPRHPWNFSSQLGSLANLKAPEKSCTPLMIWPLSPQGMV